MSFLAITVVPVAVLAWLTWRIFEQDRALAQQAVRDRLEQSANVIIAELERDVAELEASLGAANPAAIVQPRDDAVVVTFTSDGTTVQPRGRLPYYPAISTEAALIAFGPGEELEFHHRDYPGAIRVFQDLSQSQSPRQRGEALVRLARAQRKNGQLDDALATYTSLGALGDLPIAHVPAQLLALDSRCALLVELGRAEALRREATLLAEGLRENKWRLDRASYLLYSNRAHAWLGASDDGIADSVVREAILADAVTDLWNDWNSMSRGDFPVRSRLTRWVGDSAVLVFWSASGDSLRALVARPQFLAARHVASWDRQRVRVSLIDSEGRTISGEGKASGSQSVTRSTGESRLPWTVRVASINAEAELAQLAGRRGLLLSVLGVTALLTVLGGYLTVRATARELAVARLQSDFVSAVSHEFRTPLTSLRHLTELLATGAVQDEDRRGRYFAMLSSETERLHRMVEGLLEFGRIAAGRRTYEFERVDATSLVKESVADFNREIEHSGRRVEIGSRALPQPRQVRVDREAIGRAIRNILENAVKYSAPTASVLVSVREENDRIAIDVRDEGAGIPLNEQAVIFDQFVRGSAAQSLNVKGTGIGLSMVRHIVRAHGGEMSLTSEPGNGSTFTMVLPVAEGASGQNATLRAGSRS